MLKRDYEGQVCSVARALELVGERWTLLIIRDAFLGQSRFDEFQESLGIARNVLTERLNRLVEAGIFERVPYNDRPARYEYLLTPKGRELSVPLLALMQWGDRHLSAKPPRVAQRRGDKARVVATLVSGRDGTAVDPTEVEIVPGPGAARRSRNPSPSPSS